MRRLLFENIGWKLMSLALAVALWFAVIGDPGLTGSISAPLEFRNMPAELEISSDIPDGIRLEIQGPSSQLRNPALSGVAVVLDLSSVHRHGERTFTVDERTVTLPAGVRLVRAVPSQLRLRLERRTRREAPVKVRFSGPPPEGYRVLRQEVRPPSVRIVGPESCVNGVKAAESDPIDLDAVVGEREFRVETFLEDRHVRFESSSEVVVRVAMEKINGGAAR